MPDRELMALEWAHSVDPAACAHEGHLPMVTYGLLRGYRVRCLRCELKLGPWRRRATAERVRQLFDGPPVSDQLRRKEAENAGR